MIEDIYASILFIAAGFAIMATFRPRRRRISGEILGFCIILIGIAAAVEYFQPFPAFLVYAIAAIGSIITIVSVYLMFDKKQKAI